MACGVSSSSSHSSASIDDDPNMSYLFRARCRTDYIPSNATHPDVLHFKVPISYGVTSPEIANILPAARQTNSGIYFQLFSYRKVDLM